MTKPFHDQFSDSTSTGLLDNARAEFPDAWNRLYRVYGPMVYRWCRRAQIPEQDAADIVQDVFRSVFGHLNTFRKSDEKSSFRAWIYTITMNRIRDYARHGSTRPRAVGGSDVHQRMSQVPWDTDESQQPQDRAAITQRVLELIQTEFESKTWQAFWMSAVDGRNASDIGEELQMSANAVRQAKFRVLRRLRDELTWLS